MLDTCWFDSFINSCRTSNGLCGSGDTSWGWTCARGWRARRPPQRRAAEREKATQTPRVPGRRPTGSPQRAFPPPARPAQRSVSARSPAARCGPRSRRAELAAGPAVHAGNPPQPRRTSSASPRSVRVRPPVSGAPAAPGGCGAQGEASGGAGAAGVLQAPSRASPGPRAAPPARPRRFRAPPPARPPAALSSSPSLPPRRLSPPSLTRPCGGHYTSSRKRRAPGTQLSRHRRR